MQIDGHHTGTYIAARLAGFSHPEADIISYAAQYVDDAINDGPIRFANSPYMYARIASAHSMIDYNNLIEVNNHLAWIPFHFLPGNYTPSDGRSPAVSEMQKLICRPDSPIARDMLRMALRDRDQPRALHRLGIAMHVYADTFAHQGFIGAMSQGNRASNVTSGDAVNDQRIRSSTKKGLLETIQRNVKALIQLIVTSVKIAYKEHRSLFKFWHDFFSGNPLGHAEVDVFPDLPYLQWQYTDWTGKLIVRNNPADYLHAFNMMTKAMQAWRANNASFNLTQYPGISSADLKALDKLIQQSTDPDGEVRHRQWCKAIKEGVFSFGPAKLTYTPKGQGSWKDKALGTTKHIDTGFEKYHYSPSFLSSDWKLFHDALQCHRSDIVHDVLPVYGICAA